MGQPPPKATMITHLSARSQKAKKQRLQLIRADLPWLFSSLAGYCRLASTEHTIGENVAMDPPRSRGGRKPL
jgi:hypothetical protein